MKKITHLLLLASTIVGAQQFSKEDTLKGSDTQFRNFWDVKKYEITVEADPSSKAVKGSNIITFEITKDVKNPVFQIDLQKPMDFKLVQSSAKLLNAKRDGDFIFIESKKSYKKGDTDSFNISFSGKPTVARRAPWDGGWVFSKDRKGNPWISVAQEGIGTSVWLPCKDIWNDEADNGVIMNIITPLDLVGVGNGKLVFENIVKDKKTWTWEVNSPINTYSIVPNIGKYTHFSDTFAGENGDLNLDYYVLEDHLELAQKQFAQVQPMLKAFEYWFGPYPFYEDSYKLVETPYLGMEHQSNIAYGNEYKNGYLGNDLSGTGVGLGWDYILIHESGHEWFANSITAKDQADLWIHEGFTCYSETLFTEKFSNKADANRYVQGLRNNIQNDIPIIGQYGVRNEGSGDMYYKGANMLHTIRQVMDNDDLFRNILRGMNQDFFHETVTSKQVEDYISKKAGIDFSTVFDQYLRTTQVPILEYEQKGKTLTFRYRNVVKNFQLPLKINGGSVLLRPTDAWQSISLKSSDQVVFDPNYYVEYQSH